METKEEKIDNEFKELIGSLTDEQFFSYVNSWYDEQNYLDIMNDWDTEIKEEEIKKLKKMLKENPYYKVKVTDIETGEEEVSNRVIDLNEFIKSYNPEYFTFEVEKLNNEEYLENENNN